MGASLLLAWGSLGSVLRVDGIPYPHGLAAWVDLAPLVRPEAALVATVLYGVAVAAFVRDRHATVAAAGIAGALALGTHLQACQWPEGLGVNGATTLPGAALTAWLFARGVTHARAPEVRERAGVEAACGIVAAAYPLASASKLMASGLRWASGGNIALHIAAQSYAGWPGIQPLRLATAATPALCGALGIGTLVIECGALAFVWRPARRFVAVAIVGMHLGISLLMGLHHYDWMFTALGFAWWRVPSPEGARAAA